MLFTVRHRRLGRQTQKRFRNGFLAELLGQLQHLCLDSPP
jgi:hypothetical protein